MSRRDILAAVKHYFDAYALERHAELTAKAASSRGRRKAARAEALDALRQACRKLRLCGEEFGAVLDLADAARQLCQRARGGERVPRVVPACAEPPVQREFGFVVRLPQPQEGG